MGLLMEAQGQSVPYVCCVAGWSKFWGDDGYIKIHRGGNEWVAYNTGGQGTNF